LVLASFAIVPMLLAALLSTIVRGTIPTTGFDPTPTPGSLGAVVTTITTLRIGRDKPAFTAFEQAAARTPVRMGLWTGGRRTMK